MIFSENQNKDKDKVTTSTGVKTPRLVFSFELTSFQVSSWVSRRVSAQK
jgi:hypothetical protein